MTDFSHIKERLDPAGRKAWIVLPIEGVVVTREDGTVEEIEPALECCYTGRSNRQWTKEMARRMMSKGAHQRIAAMKNGAGAIAVMDRDEAVNREMMPLFCVTSWRGIPGGDGAEVPYSADACKRLFQALPPEVIDYISTQTSSLATFLVDDEPSPEGAEAYAGN